MKEIKKHAQEAVGFLKGLANTHRLLILCQLSEEEKSVSELIETTGLAQTSMSQHLSKLKEEKIVTYRRDHRVLYYRIDHEAVRDVITILYQNFCQGDKK